MADVYQAAKLASNTEMNSCVSLNFVHVAQRWIAEELPGVLVAHQRAPSKLYTVKYIWKKLPLLSLVMNDV